MKYPDNILEVILLPDYMGFIFGKKSAIIWRDFLLTRSIKKKVGVLLNETAAIAEKYWNTIYKQFNCTEESVAFCQKLRNQLAKDIEIIKVFSIQDEFDFSILEPFEAVCDYFLLILRGITWRKRNNFRLDSIRKLSFDKTIFLSGGIGLEELDAVNKS
jgi:phosphoribosylanthranilate isomerase